MKHLATAFSSLLLLLTEGYANFTNFIFNPEATQPLQVIGLCPSNTIPEIVSILGTRRDRGKAIVLYDLSCQSQDAVVSKSRC
jgi:hypothetical protein